MFQLFHVPRHREQFCQRTCVIAQRIQKLVFAQFRLEKADFNFFIVTLYTFEVNLLVSCEIDFYNRYLVFYYVSLTCMRCIISMKLEVTMLVEAIVNCAGVLLVRSVSVIQYRRVQQWTGCNRSAAARSFTTLQWVQV